jgi:adenylate cyclase
MSAESFKRKLTAILSADVKGYSRLMGEDEDATIRTLSTYRELMSTLIQKHRGRVVDSPGDNLLAEFSSVVDSVRCAVEIQEELRVRNDELPENRRMEVRIGINLGDVVEEGERIYGDGVNIAARVEGLAEGGGICISGTVYDSIKNKLSLGYEPMGEHTVKNIKEPVRVYRMRIGPEAAGKVNGEKEPKHTRWGWKSVAAAAVLVLVAGGVVWNFYWRASKIEPASKEKMAFPLPDKPSIAVMPFDNMSGDPKQDYFSDGITEEIISTLSRISGLFVIARNSSFTYKGKAVWVPDVSRELGVGYILEGSVRRSGDRVRITAQLIDGKTNQHIWSETYDRELKDIFAVQDEITMKILTNVKVKLTGDEDQTLLAANRSTNLQAYLKILEGIAYNSESRFSEAKKAFEEALSLDPKSPAYGWVAWTYLMEVWFGPTATRAQSLGKAFEYAEKCLEQDSSNEGCNRTIGYAYLLKRDYEKALYYGKRSTELNPNSANSAAILAFILRCVGKCEEAIRECERAMRLDPRDIGHPLFQLGATYEMMGRHEEAIEACKKVVGMHPRNMPAWLVLTMAYSSLDRMEEARAAASEVLKLNPNFSVEPFAKAMPYKIEENRKIMADALRKAGMK